MKRSIWLAVFALTLATAAVAQDYIITRTVFIPSTYYVGDTVEMRINLHSAFAKTMSVPQKIPQPNWGVIQSMQLIAHENEPELHIIFTSYAAGTLSLPQINLGQVVLEGVNVYVTSTLGKSGQTNLAPMREQATAPGTAWSLFLQIAVLLAIPAGLVLLVVKVRPAVGRALHRRQSALPYRRLQKSLHRIETEIESLDARNFYIGIMNDVRSYLSDRLKLKAMAATTVELEQSLHGVVKNQASVQTVIALFQRGDRVKFAGETASLSVRMSDLHNLEAALRSIEQAEHLDRLAAEAKRGSHVDA